MMFAIHNNCELSTRQTPMFTGLFFLFSLSLELLLRNSLDLVCVYRKLEWIPMLLHSVLHLQLRRSVLEVNLDNAVGDWIQAIAWHNRRGTHGTLLLLQCKVARCEGSQQDLDQARYGVKVRQLARLGCGASQDRTTARGRGDG
jgi:hypothetical protein